MALVNCTPMATRSSTDHGLGSRLLERKRNKRTTPRHATLLGSRTSATSFMRPSHLEHFSTSTAKARAINCAQRQYRDHLRLGFSFDRTSFVSTAAPALPRSAPCGISAPALPRTTASTATAGPCRPPSSRPTISSSVRCAPARPAHGPLALGQSAASIHNEVALRDPHHPRLLLVSPRAGRSPPTARTPRSWRTSARSALPS